jgi:hypothetical protein
LMDRVRDEAFLARAGSRGQQNYFAAAFSFLSNGLVS